MKAIWQDEYDFYTDSIYKRPCCPECREPIGLDGNNKYRPVGVGFSGDISRKQLAINAEHSMIGEKKNQA